MSDLPLDISLTRSPDYPPEIAQLVAACSACAQQHDVLVVLNASIQMLVWSLHSLGKHHGATLDTAVSYAQQEIFEGILTELRSNWNRDSRPGDVPVRAS